MPQPPTGSAPIDLALLRGWIGRSDTAAETVTPELARRFAATLGCGCDPAAGAAAPLLIHLCIAPPAAAMTDLGRDGHPAKGGFLPPVPLPRRMWAGGAFTFHDAPRIGEEITRRSTVTDVTLKQGRTGPLCFVTVQHEITGPDARPLLTERQDIVYRSEATDTAAKAAPPAAPAGHHQRRITPTPTLLFRYSALTFNGHRIHYDAPYARQVEGYPGLVVHGPMLATLLCHFAADLHGQPPKTFHFRSLSTLFDDADIILHAEAGGSTLRLWAARDGGPVAMDARAEF
ncbi:HTD2 family dehydratase [Novispirillum itersonii]|uniref:3-methylfumaryl-CoA hydratase n=1 Tax=Novispirillum itersonii TaxID=189 RepID=A0A7W9ZFC3_NOVIT|nr:MaoC family dehydratase N-terminal domain-containing protein [Novispirillum itersonii]MBB6210461.1 3-methylfumaryl-CoA hydratase [Novispirillum itersonii]